jgi:hypothetical protein
LENGPVAILIALINYQFPLLEKKKNKKTKQNKTEQNIRASPIG